MLTVCFKLAPSCSRGERFSSIPINQPGGKKGFDYRLMENVNFIDHHLVSIRMKYPIAHGLDYHYKNDRLKHHPELDKNNPQ